MSAMKNLRDYLDAKGLASDAFSIQATVTLQKAYTKGDLDFYEPEVTSIALSDGSITHVIELSPAFDEVARAVFSSRKVPLNRQSTPKGSEISTPVVQVVLPLDLTMRREEADWELHVAMHDDTEGSEQRFQDARWKVYTLSDMFDAQPYTREVFDTISREHTLLVRDQVERAVEGIFLGSQEDEEKVKRALYNNFNSGFKVHPRDQLLSDAVVENTIASRSQTLKPLGAIMSFEKKQTPDFWEQLDATSYYRPLSPKTVDQYFSGEVDDVFISRDHGKWWLKVDGVVGEDPYDTLEAAKEAGDTVVNKSDNEMTDAMLANLDLSTDEWKLEIVHGLPVITSLTSDDFSLSAGETSPRWSLLHGNDFIIETDDFSAAISRAKDLVQSPGLTP